MKLHDLRPPAGSHTARTRVGRGIAAGKGKTAGRGTKGQKARAGGSIPPWFEGGQTPLHRRIPKLRGFKNRFKVEYEVVNVGAIAAAAERGAFEAEHPGSTAKGAKAAPATVNQDILRAVGLVRTLNKPLKILGAGELSTPLFVVADAFTKSATAKIEAAGGTISVLEVPTESRPAIGVGEEGSKAPRERRTAAGREAASREASAKATRISDAEEREAAAQAVTAAKSAGSSKKAKAAAEAPAAEAAAEAPDASGEAGEAAEAAEAAAGKVAPAEGRAADVSATTDSADAPVARAASGEAVEAETETPASDADDTTVAADDENA